MQLAMLMGWHLDFRISSYAGTGTNVLQMKWDGEWRGWMDMWGLSGGAESAMEGAIES